MSDAPSTAPDPPPPLDRTAVRAAAQWLAQLHSGRAGPDDRAACERWRQAAPANEQAWQRAVQLQQQLGGLPPEVARQVLARPRGAGRRNTLRGLGLLAAATPAGYLAWTGWGHGLAGDHHTAVGERRELRLADGTALDLNTDTALDVDFTSARRRVALRHGELLVATAHEAGRPFVLGTAWGELQALGTRFLVRSGRRGARLTVFDGAVALRLAAGATRTLAGGAAIDFDATGFGPHRVADMQATAWTRGLLVAQDQRLDEFLRELGRHRRGLLQCDPAVATLRLSGAFQLDRSDAVIDALPATLPVRVVWRTRWWASLLPVASGA
jgi:transmembrane sensor